MQFRVTRKWLFPQAGHLGRGTQHQEAKIVVTGAPVLIRKGVSRNIAIIIWFPPKYYG